MRIFRFDAAAGRGIDQFDSLDVVMSPIQRGMGQFQLGCIRIGPGGRVGRHQAAGPQLFLVVSGEGWVSGEQRVRVPIAAGQAAFWSDGEWHESGSDAGMAALVLETDTLDPAHYMPEVTADDQH